MCVIANHLMTVRFRPQPLYKKFYVSKYTFFVYKLKIYEKMIFISFLKHYLIKKVEFFLCIFLSKNRFLNLIEKKDICKGDCYEIMKKGVSLGARIF